MHFIGTMLFKVSLLRDYLRFIVIERFNLGRFVAQLHFSRTRTPLFFFTNSKTRQFVQIQVQK